MEINEDSEFAGAVEVVSGSPTDTELAAVIAVLLEASTHQNNFKLQQRSTWSMNDSILRSGIVVGNGQWGSIYKQGL